MRKRLLGITLGIILLTPTFVTVAAQDKKTDYDAEIQAAKAASTGIQAELETSLAAVNQVYQKAYESKKAVTDSQANIEALTKQIGQTDAEMAARKAVMGEQLRQVQTDNISTNFITTLMSAGNLSDMITRMVSLTTYRNMQAEKVTNLDQLRANSIALKSDLKTQQVKLQADAQAYEKEYAQLETKLATLRTQIADNQAQMTALAASKAAQEKRDADAAAREKAKVSLAPQQNPAKQAVQPIITPDAGSANPITPVSPNAPSGQTMTVSTTGYSSDGADGMTPGHITATGIDLWVNPMCIAVDPSVIPLGSMVEVPGYGIAIAGDTGGAIKGYKVDLHFKTTNAAINWGRRTVTIKVLG